MSLTPYDMMSTNRNTYTQTAMRGRRVTQKCQQTSKKHPGKASGQPGSPRHLASMSSVALQALLCTIDTYTPLSPVANNWALYKPATKA